jgi:hypothetical protein
MYEEKQAKHAEDLRLPLAGLHRNKGHYMEQSLLWDL